MKKISITNEIILFSAAIILALLIRFIGLGSSQLTDPEAKVALQAYCTTECRLRDDIYQPLYINLTTDLFQVFAANNFWARFVSALAGTALCATPFLIRKKIGSGSAILFSFILAVEPSLVAISRQAGSPILSILFFSLTVIFLVANRPILSGIFLGLALLSGPAFWLGALSFVFALLLGWMVRLIRLETIFQQRHNIEKVPTKTEFQVGKFGLSLLGSVLIFGSNFVTRVGNLSGIVGGVIGYLREWKRPVNAMLSLKLMFITIIVYGLFSLVFGISGIIRGLRSGDKLVTIVSIWCLFLVIFLVLQPDHAVNNIAWLFFQWQ